MDLFNSLTSGASVNYNAALTTILVLVFTGISVSMPAVGDEGDYSGSHAYTFGGKMPSQTEDVESSASSKGEDITIQVRISSPSENSLQLTVSSKENKSNSDTGPSAEGAWDPGAGLGVQ